MKADRTIEEVILSIRDQRVILAGDLAAVYGVETRRLNEQVRRNAARFPADFVFQLSKQEFEQLVSRSVILADGRAALRSQNATLKRGQHIKFPPYAFTEHGAIMAAMVLNSPEALAMSVYVVRAFIQMREHLASNAAILKRLAEIDKTLLQHDASLRDIYHKLLPLLQPSPEPPKRRIGFTSED
jgi:phage regulator Rha-like protein